jgi:cyclophilin family peptidyl-prolyl cis-trans isomerase
VHMALQAQNDRDTRTLCDLLQVGGPEVRTRAALAFASYADSNAHACIRAALVDAHAPVRRAAAVAVSCAASAELLADLSRQCDRETDTALLAHMLDAAFRAQIALGMRQDPADLLAVLGTGHRYIRVRAAHALARLAQGWRSNMWPLLLQAAQNETDADVRAALVWALRHHPNVPRASLMRWAEEDTAVGVRVSALRVLGEAEDAQLAGYFMDRLLDGVGAVRMAAMEQLECVPNLDTELAWEWVHTVTDRFVQLRLCGLILKHDRISAVSPLARDFLQQLLAQDNYDHAEAAILSALLQDRGQDMMPLARTAMLGPVSPVVRTMALQGAIRLIRRGVPGQQPLAARDQQAALSMLLRDAIGTGDGGLVARAAEELLEDSTLATYTLDAELVQAAIPKLHPTRDLEALLLLRKLVDRHAISGVQLPVASAPHAIDRTKWDALQPQQRYLLRTDKGDIVLAINRDDAPATCIAFDSLVTAGYYNSRYFHRMVPGFVVQGGCPRGDGYGAMPWSLRTEIGLGSFTAGSVGMASAGLDTESCQFFITQGAAPHLDGRYTRFAQVVEGMQVVPFLVTGDQILSIDRIAPLSPMGE